MSKSSDAFSVGDRRHFSRVSFRHELTMVDESGRRYAGAFNDVSLKGMLFWCENTPPEKSRLEGVLPLGDEELRMKGVVVRVFDQKAAIRFVEMDVESFSHLRRLVTLNMGDAEQIDKEFFDSL